MTRTAAAASAIAVRVSVGSPATAPLDVASPDVLAAPPWLLGKTGQRRTSRPRRPHPLSLSPLPMSSQRLRGCLARPYSAVIPAGWPIDQVLDRQGSERGRGS